MMMHGLVHIEERVGRRDAEIASDFQMMHGVDRHRRPELHADFGLVHVGREILGRGFVEHLYRGLGVVDVHPRPVEAEFQHPEQRLAMQIVGFAPAQRGSEIAFELPAVGLVRELLPDIPQVEILGAVLPDGTVQFGPLRILHTRGERLNGPLQRVQPAGIPVGTGRFLRIGSIRHGAQGQRTKKEFLHLHNVFKIIEKNG